MHRLFVLIILTIAVLTVFLLPSVNFILAQPVPTTGVTGIPNPLDGIDSLYDLVQAIINNIVVPIGSVVIVLMIIFAGFQFVTAQGNETKIGDAKKTFFFAVIGAAILLGSWAIAQIIKNTVDDVTSFVPGIIDLFNHYV